MVQTELSNGETVETIDSIEALRGTVPPPNEGAVRKDIGRIDHNFARFIELSPFLLLGTASVAGTCDVSPRGDLPGFVRVLDEHHLAIPERPGNRRLDSLENIVQTGRAALIFLIPGCDDTLRVNGRAAVTRTEGLLRAMAVEGKDPRFAIVLTVEEAYLHCAKAFRRSRLWQVDQWPLRAALPSAGCMLVEQLALAEMTGADLDASLEAGIAKTLW